jgi:DNA-binding response OmpR family regulator
MEPKSRPEEPGGGVLFLSATWEVVVQGRSVALKPTEFRILQLLASEPGRTFTREEILEGINDCDFAVGDRSVDVHVVHLRRKLGPAASLIRTDHGRGYRFSDPAALH